MEFQRDPKQELLITKLKIMKAELKVLAAEIKQLKSKRKECKGYVSGLGSAQYDFRVKHIARCLLRGRTLEQIENKHRDPNDPNHRWVYEAATKLVAKVTEEVNGEALRIGS